MGDFEGRIARTYLMRFVVPGLVAGNRDDFKKDALVYCH
jgi:hypothetical protein